MAYEHYLFATYSDGVPISDDDTLYGQTSFSGNFTKYGDAGVGNHATIDYYADLATGSIGSYAFAIGEKVGYNGYNANGRVERITFNDTLHFVVPAGTYDNGVAVSVSGTVQGSLNATLHAGAQMQYFINFGSQNINPPKKEVKISESKPIVVDAPFNIEVQLVAAGQTLAAEQTYDLILDAGFIDNIVWTISSDPGIDYGGSAEINFGNTMQFTAVNTPQNVTWYSDSGVFLEALPSSSVPAVSEWGMMGLFVLLVGASLWVLKSRTRQDLG